jgi:hypothetical protein
LPYRNPEVNRSYHREYKRLHRTGSCQTPCQTLLPLSFRVRTAQDVLELVAEQVHLVRTDSTASTLEKARSIGFLAGTILRAVEAADLAARLEAVERTLKLRKDES